MENNLTRKEKSVMVTNSLSLPTQVIKITLIKLMKKQQIKMFTLLTIITHITIMFQDRKIAQSGK